MRNNIYSIKDDKAGIFIGLDFQPNDEVFVRNVRTMLNYGKDTDIHKYPQDYSVFCLGEFDNCTGEFVSNVRFICNVISLRDLSVVNANAAENL